MIFLTPAGRPVPAVTEDQMREVDRVAEQEFGLSVLQMMENAGRNLALHTIEMLDDPAGRVVVLAGSGGNGGGGMCAARHLHNRGYSVELFMTRPPAQLIGSAAAQYKILEKAGVSAGGPEDLDESIGSADLVIDALIGYSLRGSPGGESKRGIERANASGRCILALDVPSGVDSTTGERPGAAIDPVRTLTLALPKVGLADVPGELFVADIGIPPALYHSIQISFEPFFGDDYWVRIEPSKAS